MKRVLICMALASCACGAGCGPMDPAARWQVYQTRPTPGEPQVQVLDVRVSMWGREEQKRPDVRLVMPDGTHWEVNLAYEEPRFWRVYRVEPDGRRVEVPLEPGTSGQSLGGACWGTVDRKASATQPR